MTEEQIIAAIRHIDTPLGRVGLIHSREDGAVVPTYVAKQFAAAIAVQLAAPVQQDAMLWRALVAIPPADIAEIAEWSGSSAEFIDRINERLLAAPQGEAQ